MEGITKKRLGIALAGLGNYSTKQLAPALQETKHCYLAGIVTGTPSKAGEWENNYGIPAGNIYSYDNFDSIKDNPGIDIVYVALPNALHAEYVVRAARAGKHVICEKPLGITADECERMIAACKEAGRMLSVGYRLHFDPYHIEMMRLGRQKVYGNIRKMSAAFGFVAGDPSQWRLNKALAGGGPLMDVGIYCVQAFCYTSGLEPIAVQAWEGEKTDPQKFAQVEQSITWQFEFPGGIIAEGKASFAEDIDYLHVDAENGSFEVAPAYYYYGQEGHTPGGPMHFAKVNQQAKQMDDFAEAIIQQRQTPIPGEMGKRDVKLLRAIYEAMETGKRIEIH